MRIFLLILLIPILATPAGPAFAEETLTPERRAEMELEIAAIRAEAACLGHDWTAGETSMMRLTPEERRGRLMTRPWFDAAGLQDAPYRPLGYDRSRAELDWRSNGGDFVTGVRNQLDCGGCWDFAGTATMESAFLISIGGGNVPDFDLSEQYVLSCIDNYGFDDDCTGGLWWDAYWFGFNVGMIEDYCLPYVASAGHPCEQSCDEDDQRRFFFESFEMVCDSPDPEAIKDALHNHGPVACGMVVYDSFFAYTGGIYQASGAIDGSHAVTIIGYNDRHQYWIVKNSWGEGWGMDGICHIAYDNGCELGEYSTYVTHDCAGMGSFAAFSVDDRRPKTGEPVTFRDRSVEIEAVITSWEWDFDGDGAVDAVGPGPHQHVFAEPGVVSPSLRVTDAGGQEDVAFYRDHLTLVFDGPVWIVDAAGGGDDGDGSPGDPLLRIQNAMNVAADGDTVLIRPGVYSGLLNRDLRAYGKSIVVRGDGAPGDVVLDGLGADRLFILDAGEGPGCSIENLTLRSGHADLAGGAVRIENASPSFVDVRFEGNTVGPDPSARGGAVWTDGASAFTRCLFENNAAPNAGGAIHCEGSACRLVDCDLLANTAARGGAVHATGGALSATACRFVGNSAAEAGGAALLAGHGELDACLFSGNEVTGETAACVGGAVALDGQAADLTLRNGILTLNRARLGGALHVGGRPLILEHVSTWGNQAVLGGAAVVSFAADLSIANSIFWGDEAPGDPEILAPLAGSDAIRHCVVAGGIAGEEILDRDPLYLDPLNADFRLASGSPCVAAGSTAIDSPSDFYGEPRPQPAGTPPDLGACESPLGGATAIAGEVPAGPRFVGIYPNPFNPTTKLSFALAEECEVRLRIYHASGRLAATLIESRLGPGRHDVSWTAADADGRPLASGLFLARLECRYPDGREEIEMRKAILIK